jgi:hypothetical protein
VKSDSIRSFWDRGFMGFTNPVGVVHTAFGFRCPEKSGAECNSETIFPTGVAAELGVVWAEIAASNPVESNK